MKNKKNKKERNNVKWTKTWKEKEKLKKLNSSWILFVWTPTGMNKPWPPYQHHRQNLRNQRHITVVLFLLQEAVVWNVDWPKLRTTTSGRVDADSVRVGGQGFQFQIQCITLGSRAQNKQSGSPPDTVRRSAAATIPGWLMATATQWWMMAMHIKFYIQSKWSRWTTDERGYVQIDAVPINRHQRTFAGPVFGHWISWILLKPIRYTPGSSPPLQFLCDPEYNDISYGNCSA